jgi:predicted nucleotidyltransferase
VDSPGTGTSAILDRRHAQGNEAICLTEQDLRTAERIRDRILEAAGDAVERIVFYGSRVTGHVRPTSDYDILVVLRDPVPAWAEASLQLSDLFNTFERPVDVQVFGELEYEESRPVAGTVAYTADYHGVCSM